MSIKFATTNVEITGSTWHYNVISGAILNFFLWSQVSFEREGEGCGVGGGWGGGESVFCSVFWFLLEDVRSRLRMSIMS